MKHTLLTISLLLSLTSVAQENPAPAKEPASPAPAAGAPANPAPAPQTDQIPCPLPGEPATNCPAPREPEVTEAGTGATASGNVHNVLSIGLLLSSPRGNALHEMNNQPVPSPVRQPVKEEK